MVADSGCQSCIIPFATAEAMGYTEADLMPVSMFMRGAIKENLEVEGGIILDITIRDEQDNPISCKQLVYVSRLMNKAFLCREALVQLCILPEDFPEVKSSEYTTCLIETAIRNCPKRTMPPPNQHVYCRV